jgi:hypothetical protein
MKKLTAEQQAEQDAKFYAKVWSAEGKDAKRALLKELSGQAKLILSMNPDAGHNVNDVILNVMYKSEQHQVFKTFKKWKEEGFKVVKGSKSFFIWSAPRKVEKKAGPDAKAGEEKESFKMFGVCYLFSNAQVTAII